VDLREAMRSPDLALDPPVALDQSVRRAARGLRRRRRVGGAALALCALGAGAAVVPALLPDDDPAQVAGVPPETFGITDATSEVVLLERVNRASVVAYFQGAEPCVAAVRVKRERDCEGAVNAATTQPFPTVFDVVVVDDRRFLAGTVTVPGPVTLLLDLAEGDPLVVTASSGRGFVVPVFHVELPADAVPVRLRAVDATGAVVATRDL
jgi:hypothetical protein